MSGQIEEWRQVPGFPNYAITRGGEIWSLPRIRSGAGPRRKVVICKRIKARVTKFGYRYVDIRNGARKGKSVFVHKAVLSAFLGPMPPPWQGNHIDGNKDNNSLDNLEWVTPSQNSQHAYDTGLSKRLWGEKNPHSKLTDAQRAEIIKSNEPSSLLAKRYGVSPRLIRHYRSGAHARTSALEQSKLILEGKNA